MNTLEKNKNELFELGDLLFRHPELGYKEFETKKILEDYLHSYGIETADLGFRTAFKAVIGKGEPHIGLIAELDAIPTPGHPFENTSDHAAHSCGHSTQCAIMAYTLVRLKETLKKGTVTLYFAPAEEFTDVAFRKKLIRNKEIKYIGGKCNLLEAGAFAKEDLLIHLHTMGQGAYHFSLNTSLTGFIYKEITFSGKASHAAIAPDKGINALNAFVLFDNAMNMLRETFREEDYIRIHGIIAEGGQTVNSIPQKVVYECYVRSMNNTALTETAARVDKAAKNCAAAIGAKVKISSTPGYLPMRQCRLINDVIRKMMLKHCSIDEIHDDEISMAAGDIGDVSCFIPTVQFGYSGFGGNCHGKDLCITDKNRAYLEPSMIVYDTVKYLAGHDDYVARIKTEFRPEMTMAEYRKYHAGK